MNEQVQEADVKVYDRRDVLCHSEQRIIAAVRSTCAAHQIDHDLAETLAGGVISRLRETMPRG